MDPVMNAFGEKVSALTPLVRPGLLERSQFKLMKTRAPTAPRAPMPGKFGISTVTKTSTAGDDSLTASHEDLLPSTRKGLKKSAMVHPSMQSETERMTPEGWKQTFKDVPFSILAGGVGYGIGKTLADMIGDRVAAGGQKPGWLKAVPMGLAAASATGAFAASRAREGLKKRREAAGSPNLAAHLSPDEQKLVRTSLADMFHGDPLHYAKGKPEDLATEAKQRLWMARKYEGDR